MERTEAAEPDVVSSAERLLGLLDAIAADLGRDQPSSAERGEEYPAPSCGIGRESAADSATQEDQAIIRARGSIARSRSTDLEDRLEEARHRAREVIVAARAEQSRASARRRPAADPASGEPGSSDTTALRATLADSARRLSRTRTESTSPDEMLRSIVAAALHAIPHVHGASITLLDRSGVITTHAPSSDLVAAVDQVQVEQRDGPCIDALDEKHTDMTHAGDLGVAPPWPTFAARALEAGFHEVLSFALVADGAAGALNLYSNAPGQFDAQDELVGALLADQAAVALTGARRVGQLNEALTSRDLIGRAKGILMERFGLSDHGAFQMLVESSQTTNLKLVAVAQWLVDETEARHERPPRS
jgi:hypothetical protein